MQKIKGIYVGGILVVVCAIFVAWSSSNLRAYYKYATIRDYFTYEEEKIRDVEINDDLLAYLYESYAAMDGDVIQGITIRMMEHDYDLSSFKKCKEIQLKEKYCKRLMETNVYQQLYGVYKMIFSDLKYFPVPVDLAGKQYVGFDNSWLSRRTYGGERQHEGTDIMTSNNVRGYFPILSVSDGVIEKKGWLEKGGYRIGVRSTNGAYFYYAHLHSYAEGLQVGDFVKAGQLLGFMGDTGYSKVEGTTGNFDVHLHFGMYLFAEKIEVSVNPYWILKYLERHKLEYYF